MKGKHNTERRVNFTPATRLSDKLQGEQLIKPKVQLYSTYFENHKKRLPPRSNLKITVKARDRLAPVDFSSKIGDSTMIGEGDGDG